MLHRRSFLWVLSGAITAPLVAKAEFLMPVRAVQTISDIKIPDWCPAGWIPANGQTVSRFQFPELHKWFTKTRQYGAHEGDNFSLPAVPHAYCVNRDTTAVQLISTAPLARPNGKICQPGMFNTYHLAAMVQLAPPVPVNGTPTFAWYSGYKEFGADQGRYLEVPAQLGYKVPLSDDFDPPAYAESLQKLPNS